MSRANKNFLDHAYPLFKRCQWCLDNLRRQDATCDHLVPVSRGGTNKWYNLLVSCYDCNHTRRNKPVINRRGAWLDSRIPMPHGPRWDGPRRRPRPITAYWCNCHRRVDVTDRLGPASRALARKGSAGLGRVVNGQNKEHQVRAISPGLRTWAEIKAMVRAAGVLDDDLVFLMDLGPNIDRIYTNRDPSGLVEIGDDPTIVASDAPELGRDPQDD